MNECIILPMCIHCEPLVTLLPTKGKVKQVQGPEKNVRNSNSDNNWDPFLAYFRSLVAGFFFRCSSQVVGLSSRISSDSSFPPK